jgi:AbrB family looped-hinge helix DNA binding protein
MAKDITVELRIGRKLTIYLPKAVAEALNIDEGDKVFLTVSGRKMVIEKVEDPIDLAIRGSKFASITPEEVEWISLNEQNRHAEGLT